MRSFACARDTSCREYIKEPIFRRLVDEAHCPSFRFSRYPLVTMPQGFARAADGGPFYTETNWAHTIREPFNATTAVIFLLIALVWLTRLRGHYREQGVI